VKKTFVISSLVFFGVLQCNLCVRGAKVHLIKEPLDSGCGEGLRLAGERDAGARLVGGHHWTDGHLWVTGTIWLTETKQHIVTWLLLLSSRIHLHLHLGHLALIQNDLQRVHLLKKTAIYKDKNRAGFKHSYL